MPEILSPQELLALESLSSLSLDGTSCQLPDATVTGGWHSLCQLDVDIGGLGDGTVLEQALDAITSLPHLESLGCCLETLPAQFSALSKLRELKLRLYYLQYRSLQVSRLSSHGHQLLHHKWHLCRSLVGVLQELSDTTQQSFQGLTSLHLEGGNLVHVPPGVMSLRGLQELSMSSCNLNLLPEGPYLRQLTSLSLEQNKFSVVPCSIAACRYLRALRIGPQWQTALQFGKGMGRVLGRLTNLTFLGMEGEKDNLSIQFGCELADFVSTRLSRGAWQQCKVDLTSGMSYVACGS